MLKLVVALLVAFTVANSITIPSGFKAVDKFLVSEGTATFFQAYITCKKYGYRLATVTSDAENLALNTSVVLSKTYYWLGGVGFDYNGTFESKWIWFDSGDELLYNHWGPNEPSPQTGDVNCIALGQDGNWRAYICKNNDLGFICQG